MIYHKKKKKDMAVIYRSGKHRYGVQLITVENSIQTRCQGENKTIWDLYGLTCGKKGDIVQDNDTD